MDHSTRSTPPLFGREAAREPAFRILAPNERAILSLLQRHSPLSRAELSRRTGLALPTISRLADQLTRDGLIVAQAKVMMSSLGQPSTPLSLRAEGAYAFGAAIRADELSIALVDLKGQRCGSVSEPIASPNLPAVIDRMAQLTTRLAQEAAVAPERVAGIGVALPGFFIADPLRINAPLGMEDWAVDELEQTLGAALGLPVSIENDGSAAAIGERIYGAGRDHGSFAYVYIDRGLGGGIIQNGTLLRGAHGNAGEFTGLLHPDSRATRPTLALLLQLAQEDGSPAQSIGQLLAALDPTSPCAGRWLETVQDTTNMVLSAIAAVFDPEAVVFGGRLPPDLAQRLAAACTFYSVPVRGRDRAFPLVAHSALEGDAAALGAAALMFDRYLL
jgi:predicted NBD/HSP70 family sugar kinase/DNA-binding transcriptional ArsR family regulator